MKQVRIFMLFMFLSSMGLGLPKAQNTLIVKETGKQTPYALKSIEKLTFTGGKMIISQSGGKYHPYELSNISKLNFVTISTDILHPGKRQSTIVLYPVPVNDQLHIRYGEKKNGIMHIEIADMLGRIVYRQVIREQAGNGDEIIDLSRIAKGLYLFRWQYGDQFETCKFLKE